MFWATAIAGAGSPPPVICVMVPTMLLVDLETREIAEMIASGR